MIVALTAVGSTLSGMTGSLDGLKAIEGLTAPDAVARPDSIAARRPSAAPPPPRTLVRCPHLHMLVHHGSAPPIYCPLRDRSVPLKSSERGARRIDRVASTPRAASAPEPDTAAAAPVARPASGGYTNTETHPHAPHAHSASLAASTYEPHRHSTLRRRNHLGRGRLTPGGPRGGAGRRATRPVHLSRAAYDARRTPIG